MQQPHPELKGDPRQEIAFGAEYFLENRWIYPSHNPTVICEILNAV